MGLDANCQGFQLGPNGKVVGVQLGIYAVAGARYEVYSVRLRSEEESDGRREAYCQVLDKNGIKVGKTVYLGFPWNGSPHLATRLPPGNPDNTHPIVNGYNPPNLGPLALYVGTVSAVESDIVYGLGLPLNHHVSYDVVFRERGAIVTPPPPPIDTSLADVLRRLGRLENAFDTLVREWEGGK